MPLPEIPSPVEVDNIVELVRERTGHWSRPFASKCLRLKRTCSDDACSCLGRLFTGAVARHPRAGVGGGPSRSPSPPLQNRAVRKRHQDSPEANRFPKFKPFRNQRDERARFLCAHSSTTVDPQATHNAHARTSMGRWTVSGAHDRLMGPRDGLIDGMGTSEIGKRNPPSLSPQTPPPLPSHRPSPLPPSKSYEVQSAVTQKIFLRGLRRQEGVNHDGICVASVCCSLSAPCSCVPPIRELASRVNRNHPRTYSKHSASTGKTLDKMLGSQGGAPPLPSSAQAHHRWGPSSFRHSPQSSSATLQHSTLVARSCRCWAFWPRCSLRPR